MYSSRKFSVERHIRLKHEGHSIAVSFTEYMVGRVQGIYPRPIVIPKTRPTFGDSEAAPTFEDIFRLYELSPRIHKPSSMPTYRLPIQQPPTNNLKGYPEPLILNQSSIYEAFVSLIEKGALPKLNSSD
jgi:hypothetical protein